MKNTPNSSIDVDTFELEDAKVPLELHDNETELEDTARTEVESAEGKLKAVFDDEQEAKKARKKKMKEKPKPLKLNMTKTKETIMTKSPHKFKTKDYIVFRCNLCERDMTHTKKDDVGNFYPYQLCQHIVFKGLYAEK